MMAPGTSSMLRARRRDVNVKPNRRLDRKSSRGMLYENEELRLRTININAEVERGQNDIKKLRRENEQLRREIWGLREEYDRLEGLLGKAKRRNISPDEDSDNGERREEEDEEYDEDEDDDEDADLDNAENQQKASSSSISRRNSLRVEFDGLSIVDEETEENQTVSVELPQANTAICFGGVKSQCFNSIHRQEQQFFGKIKLPNGKEGVFMSDAMLPNSNISNGLPLKRNSYNFEFSPNENIWSEIPTLLSSASPQGHYNYTFTPVDSATLPNGASTRDNYAIQKPNNFSGIRNGEPVFPNIAACRETRSDQSYLGRGVQDDSYFGMSSTTADCYHKRGGPDLFISGAYPVARSPGNFPVGCNLDQLLKEISGKEPETAPALQNGGTDNVRSRGNVQEVIDALEAQVDCKLHDAVLGVRVADANCYVCLAKEDNVGALLERGLTVRGEKVCLEEVPRDSILIALSGVPHDVPDSSVGRVVANYGTVVGDVKRRLYKGVDTGERIVRLKPAEADIKNVPSVINLAGSKVTMRTLKPAEVKELGYQSVPRDTGFADATKEKTTDASTTQIQNYENPYKSLDSSFTTDRFRSQIKVRLKQPNSKTNRSLDNIFDSASERKQHNTSLPIIDTSGTKPIQISSCERLVDLESLECAMPQKLSSPKPFETVHDLSAPLLDGLSDQSLHQFSETPNIFSKLPNRKPRSQCTQFLSTTDDSTDSVDQSQNNPFRAASPSYPRRPITPVTMNPFMSDPNPVLAYQDTPRHNQSSTEHQQQIFLPHPSNAAPLSLPTTVALFSKTNPLGTNVTSNFPQDNEESPGNTDYFVSNVSNIPSPFSPFIPGNVAVVPSIAGSTEYFQVPSEHMKNAFSVAIPPSAQPVSTASNISTRQQNSLAPQAQNLPNDGNREKHENIDVTSSSPVLIRKQKTSRKSGILSRQQSKSSGDEATNLSSPTAHKQGNANPPGDARWKTSRKTSCSNSIGSHHKLDNSVESTSGPNATSSPNTRHKPSVVHNRKTSAGATGGADAPGGGHVNVVEVSRSSSSGQDSPTKSDRRRRVSIYFNNKKGAGKRRDSVLVPTSGILSRSLSSDQSHRYAGGSTTDVATGHCAGAETTTTCSERERTNSASSRTSSAAGRLRRHSACSANDVSKVPWCGCWGNGCI